MYCPKCGEKNPDDARFCGSCGAPIPTSVAEAEKGREVEPTERREPVAVPTGSRGTSSAPASADHVAPEMKIGIAVATVIIPILGIVMGIVYLNSPSAEKKSAGKLWLIIAGVMLLLYCLLAF